MAIQLYCDCGNPLIVPLKLAGRKVKCKACQSVLTIPDAPDAKEEEDEKERLAQSGRYEVMDEPAVAASCPSCGAKVGAGDAACLSCGAELKEGGLRNLPTPLVLAAIGLVVFGLLFFVGWQLWQASRPGAYVAEGYAALASGDHQAARTAFETALRYDPQTPEAKVGLAEVGVAAGDGGLISRYADSAIRLTDDDALEAELHLALAWDLLDREDYLSAYNHAVDAEALDPQAKGAKAVLGLASYYREQEAEALEFLRTAAAQGSDRWEVYHFLSTLLKARGETEAAREHAEEAVELKPDDAALWLLLAELRLVEGDRSAAKAALLKTVELDPESAPAHSRLSKLYLEDGNADRALRSAERARDLDPENMLTRLAVGRILLVQGKSISARNELQRALELGSSWEAEFLMGQALVETGDVSNGSRKLVRALDQRKDDLELHLEAGRILVGAEDSRSARQVLERAVQLDPTSYEARLLFAKALAGGGRGRNDEHIREQLERAIEANPRRPDAPLELGLHHRDLGEGEAAVAAFDRGLEHNPDHVRLLYLKGRTAVEMDDWRDALPALEQVQRLEPAYEDSQEWLRKARELRFYDPNR